MTRLENHRKAAELFGKFTRGGMNLVPKNKREAHLAALNVFINAKIAFHAAKIVLEISETGV